MFYTWFFSRNETNFCCAQMLSLKPDTFDNLHIDLGYIFNYNNMKSNIA